ncbi:shufflon system plasmid conjugative transfer pilus tip adhesin PilV [Sediminicola sp. YIK13]|uniref:shufflon system plasmid conjugative transfer pilus tip adhesin PilV n=1 Tax=Sediminicola sp. YIK13 TaxID=1453352 RepID=UPI0007864825|nr:shufflon system plasmid conjugative transfer pilus tip adhesin PilV [Sediminicola sp. YIK13]
MRYKIVLPIILISLIGAAQTQTNVDLVAGEGNGFRFWNGNNSYKIHMGSSAEYKYGTVNDYSIKMNMSGGTPSRGWTWGVAGATPIASLNTMGDFQVAREMYLAGGWLRVKGDKGLFFQDYGGGFYMTDSNWIRTYGNKSFYHNTGTMRTDGRFEVGPSGDRFTVTSEGNVGIGVTAPQYDLQTSAGVQLRKTAIGVTSATNENSWIRDEWLTGSYGPAKWNQSISRWVRPAGTYNDIGGIVFQDEGTYFLREKAGSQLEYTNSDFLKTAFLFSSITNGYIGIGTNIPDSKLTVKGNIHAEEVKVDLSVPGPDYVFKEGYDLMSLSEIQNYIKSNGHLPNIPSAKEMEANGIELGVMNMKLLEKIEELTLYILDAEKNDNEQKAMIDKLEERLSLIEKNIKL